MAKDEFYFPVRFVESGRFLQRVAIAGLEFADSAGQRLGATGRLEIALWPDRAVLSFALEKDVGEAEGVLVIEAGKRRNSIRMKSQRQVVLELFGPENAPSPLVETEGDLEASRSEETGCMILKLPSPPWKNAKGTYYPEEELDRLDRWRFTVRNESESQKLAMFQKYVADIQDRKIYRYRINKDATLADKYLFAGMGADGITLDQRGNLYLTGNGITVFNPAGEKIAHIAIGPKSTSNLCFGGKDRKELFVTSSESIFVLSMQVKGVE